MLNCSLTRPYSCPKDWVHLSIDGHNGNHVGIDLNGNINSVQRANIGTRMNNGAVWYAWVDYDGDNDLLEVRLSQTATRPASPLMTRTVDLVAVRGQASAFVGFTSGTGGASGDHDIRSWQFTNTFQPIIVPLFLNAGGPYSVNEGASVTLQATASVSVSFDWDLDNDGLYDDATGANPVFTGIDGPSVQNVAVQATVQKGVFWDFENAVNMGGGVSTSVGAPIGTGVTGTASQTGGGPAETFGGGLGKVHLTRFLGSSNYPYIDFTTTEPMNLDSVSFFHIHNHNSGFPTQSGYQVQLQIDSGSGYSNIGSPLAINAGNSSQTSTINLGSTPLSPGTYRIRWLASGYSFGSNSGTEFFAMNNLNLNMSIQEVAATTVTVNNVAPTIDTGIVDLNAWIAENISSGSGVWNVASGGNSVLQTVNGNPTFFYSDFNALGSPLKGSIKVETTGDDDFIGFAIGFDPGDTTNSSADYLLVDWKQGNQSAFGGFAPRGLAVSRVTGVSNNTNFWAHNGPVTELARGSTLGSTGWGDNQSNEFQFDFSPTRLRVFVNGTLELNVTPTGPNFSDGRFAFYNFSLGSVRYSAIQSDSISGNEASPVSFSKNFTDPGILDTHTATINWGDSSSSSGTITEPSGSTPGTVSGTHTYADNGTYTVSVTVCDDNSGCDSDTFTATIANVAPTANAGGPYSVDEGSSVTLSATGNDVAGVADPLTYAWDLDNNGSFETPGQNVTFSGADGTFSQTVKVRVSDGDGGTAIDSATVTVNNVAPTVDADSDATVDEGSVFTSSVGCSGAVFNPANGHYYLSVTTSGATTWNISNPAAQATTCGGSQGYLATVTSAAETAFIAANLPTAVNGFYYIGGTQPAGNPETAGGWTWVTGEAWAYTNWATGEPNNASGEEALMFWSPAGSGRWNDIAGSNVFSSGYLVEFDPPFGPFFADPGADSWSGTVDYGDGSGVQSLALNPDKTFTLSHTYGHAGTYTVTATVTDDDGGSGSDTMTVTVANVAPTITSISASPTSINEGESVTVTATFTDPSWLDVHTATANCGDGTQVSLSLTGENIAPDSTGTGTIILVCAFADDNPTATASDIQGISITVIDDLGDSDSASVNVTINNVIPKLSGTSITDPINENDSATLTGTITDLGVEDTFTLVVDWDDGNIETFSIPAAPSGSQTFSFTHQYLDDDPTGTPADNYIVKFVSLTDDDGGAAGTDVGGNIFLTGHDPDFHAQDEAGAKNLIRAGVDYARNGGSLPMLWVESKLSVPAGHRLGKLGLTASGYVEGIDFVHMNAAELNALPASVWSNLEASYSAIGVASDFGGILTDAEKDVLIAHKADFVNAGGGLFAGSECSCSGYSLGGDPAKNFAFLPITVTTTGNASPPYSVTGFGLSEFGLVSGDVNSPSHSHFDSDFGLNIVTFSSPTSQIMTLAGNVRIDDGGLSQGLKVTVNNVAPP